MDKVDLSAASLPLSPSIVTALKTETKKTRGKSEAEKSRKTGFSAILRESAAEIEELGPLQEFAPSEDALAALMDEVHSAGSELLDRPFSEEILRYKKAVRNFMHYVVENGYELRKIPASPRKVEIGGRSEWVKKVHHQVIIIDRELEKLAAAILSGQTNQLQRVSKLDEIRGLLVDLTVSGRIKERNDRFE